MILNTEPRELLARLGVAPGTVPDDHIFESAEDAVVVATDGEGRRLESIPSADAESAHETAG
jgi:hypothetical protein